jgi:hypothetical protein
VDGHIKGEKAKESKTYGVVLSEIYKKLSSDVHATEEVDSEVQKVVSIVVGAPDSREVNVLVCLLEFFAFPIEVVEFIGDKRSEM